MAKPSHGDLVFLISELVDEGDCTFDHHGGCQSHGFDEVDDRGVRIECPHARAKRIIEAHGYGWEE